MSIFCRPLGYLHLRCPKESVQSHRSGSTTLDRKHVDRKRIYVNPSSYPNRNSNPNSNTNTNPNPNPNPLP